jgi:protein SCO1/2
VFRRVLSCTLLFIVLITTAACGWFRKEEMKQYPLSGRVVAIDTKARQIIVAHEEIPGFMDKMTMGFTPQHERDLQRVSSGDWIEGTLHVGENRSYLEILVIQRSLDGGDASPKPRSGAQPGDAVPDAALITHSGRRVRLSDYRGRTVALTFIFTRCPLPDFCPRMSDNFSRIAKSLGKDSGARDRYQLLTVSFDPAYDTPEVLARNRALFRPKEDPAAVPWDFVTGTDTEIRRLADFLGLTYEGEDLDIVHNLRTAVVDSEGKVVEVWGGNDWKPEQVLRALLGK